MAVVLREEVEPARGRAGRGRRRLRRAPRARGRAGARGGDRVPGPDRRAAGAEVAAAAAGRRGGARRARPRGGGRGAAGADARVPPLPRRLRRPWSSASRRRAATSTARRRCRRSCAASRSTPPTAAYDPEQLGVALGDLLTTPPEVDISHIRPTVSLERRLRALRDALARRASFDFDEQFGGEDRLTQAVTLFALLELYRKGEVTWEQSEPFGPIEIRKRRRRGRMSDLARTIEALLFLSPQPVGVADLAEATEATEGQVDRGDRPAARGPRRGQARGRPARGRRRLRAGQRPGARGGGAAPARQAAHAAADPGPGRDAGDRRLPAAGLAAGGRPHPRRLLGVGGADAGRARPDRGVGALALRRRDLQDDRAVRAALRPRRASTSCPTPRAFDPTPEDERELRERLLKARGAARGRVRPSSRGGSADEARQVPRPRGRRLAADGREDRSPTGG